MTALIPGPIIGSSIAPFKIRLPNPFNHPVKIPVFFSVAPGFEPPPLKSKNAFNTLIPKPRTGPIPGIKLTNADATSNRPPTTSPLTKRLNAKPKLIIGPIKGIKLNPFEANLAKKLVKTLPIAPNIPVVGSILVIMLIPPENIPINLEPNAVNIPVILLICPPSILNKVDGDLASAPKADIKFVAPTCNNFMPAINPP